MKTARPEPLIARSGLALAVAATLVAATLVACSSEDSGAGPAGSVEETTEASSAPADEAAGDTDAADDEGTFCDAFEENGGTGATVGPLQLWLPKEDLAADLTSRLTAMGDLEAPAEVSAAWDASKTYFEDLQTTVDALPAGGIVDDPAVYSTSTEMEETFSTFTDWYFDTCQ